MAFVIALAAIVALRPSLSRSPRRFCFLVVALVAYALGPQAAFGRAFVFERFAVFTAVAAVFALDVRSHGRIARLAIATLAIGWSVLVATRFHAFGRESEEFRAVTAAMPTNRRLAYYIGDFRGASVPGAVYLRFPAYYQEHQG